MPPNGKTGYVGLIFVVTAVLVYVFVNKGDIFAPKYLGDLHMHTLCSDGKNSYEEMIQSAIQNNLSFIAITDHWVCGDTLKACKEEKRILCFPGQEISSPGRHLLGINIVKNIDSNLPLVKQVGEVHAQGGIAIAAHPNAKEFYYTDEELKNSGIDAQECKNNTGERRFLPCVWDSDAHNSQDLAWQFSSCVTPIKSINDLKTAILSGKCRRVTSLPILNIQKMDITKE